MPDAEITADCGAGFAVDSHADEQVLRTDDPRAAACA